MSKAFPGLFSSRFARRYVSRRAGSVEEPSRCARKRESIRNVKISIRDEAKCVRNYPRDRERAAEIRGTKLGIGVTPLARESASARRSVGFRLRANVAIGTATRVGE